MIQPPEGVLDQLVNCILEVHGGSLLLRHFHVNFYKISI